MWKWIEQHPVSVGLVTSVAALILSIIAIYISWSQLPENPAALIQIIRNEALYARTGNVDAVVDLFSDGAVIRDTGYYSSFEDPRPGKQWQGKEQIRARYEELKQNVTYDMLNHIGIHVTFDQYGNRASATSSTQGQFKRGNQVKNVMTINGDLWTFEKTARGWKITDFSYHLPPIR